MAMIAGDIGGTHTRLAVLEGGRGTLRVEDLEVYSSQDHHSLTEILERYKGKGHRSFEGACFGVAGPVRNGGARITNLPWRVDEEELARALDVPTVVVNDVEAVGWGIPLLGPDDVTVLLEGEEGVQGNGAVIAPGTGLGQAGLFWDGQEHRPFPSEGGHADFAPVDEVDWGLQMELARRFGHVSWERVVSGPGMEALHRFLCRRSGAKTKGCPLESLEAELSGPELSGPEVEDAKISGPEVITRAAGEGRCPACADTVQRFCRVLGAQAGNLALTLLATAGVWIGGGIAPDILPLLQEGSFREGFIGKGRLQDLMGRIPVRVITDQYIALKGAGRCGFRRLQNQ
jgi:glucokinase